MGFTDALKAAGFKPEASTEGQWTPYKGTYKVQFVKCEEETSQKTNEKQLKVEFKIVETLEGKEHSTKSQYNDFRKYLALEGADVANKKKGVSWIINALYTGGKDVSGASDEETLANIQGALGLELYFSAWGWTPADGEKPMQMFSVLKEDVAMKKVKKAATPF